MVTHFWMTATQTFVPDEFMGEGWSVHCPKTANNFSVERDVFLWLRPNTPLAQRKTIESVIQMYGDWLAKPRPRGFLGWLKAKWHTISYGRCHHGIGFERLCPTCATQHRQCIAFLQDLKQRVISLSKRPITMEFTDEEMANGAKLYLNVREDQARVAEDIVMRYGQALAKNEAGDIARPESLLSHSKREIFIAFKAYLAWLVQNGRLSKTDKDTVVKVFATLHQWVADREANLLNQLHNLRSNNLEEYAKRDLAMVEQLHRFQQTFFGIDLREYADRFIGVCTKLKI